MDEGTQTSLVLYDQEGHLHLTAQRRKPQHQFDGVDVARYQDDGSLLLLDEGGNVLQPELELVRDVGGLSRLDPLDQRRRTFLPALLLGGHGLGTVLVAQLEDVRRLVLVDGLGELVDRGMDLQALAEDGALAQDPHVLGPTHEAAEVASSGADGPTDVEGAGTGRDEWVDLGDGGLGGRGLAALYGLVDFFGAILVGEMYGGKINYEYDMVGEAHSNSTGGST